MNTITIDKPVLSTDFIKERFYGLDAVRAFALLLGIFFHGVESLVSFMPPMLWAVKDTQSSVAIDVFFYIAHIFRMQAFFLVAGFFAHMLYQRLQAKDFAIHRLKRIALPLAIFWPIVYFSIVVLWTWGFQRMTLASETIPVPANQSIWSTAYTTMTSLTWLKTGFPWGHLWFLYFLLWMYALVLFMAPVCNKLIDRTGRFRVWIDKSLRVMMNKWWGALLLAIFTIPAMWGMKNGFGVDTPDFGLLPKLPSFLVYLFYFTLGWFLHRNISLLHLFRKHWKVNLLLSSILISIVTTMFYSVTYHPELFASIGPYIIPLGLLYNSLYALASMTAVFAFTGIMLTYFSQPNKKIRYVADASYWMYLIHLPVVVLFQILVGPYNLHWVIKLLLIFIPSFFALLTSYHFLVRNTLIGQLLNGKRIATK